MRGTVTGVWAVVGMRWAGIVVCCLFLAFTLAGGGAPLLAADIPQGQSDEGPYSDDAATENQVADFCDSQRQICRKICYLRFRDDLIGCPQRCVSRVSSCDRSGCYRWTEPEFVIAERFGGFKCFQ